MEIRGPVNPLQNEKVAFVHLPDGPDQPAVEGQHPGVILAVPLGQGLVQQVIAADGRFSGIARGQEAPHPHQQILVVRVHIQLRKVRRAVVDVLPGLAAGGSVHIQNQIQPVFPAPPQAVVHILEDRGVEPNLLAGDVEQGSGIQGQPQGVHTLPGHPGDVSLRNVGIVIPLPEVLRVLRAAKLPDQRFDPPGTVTFCVEFPHISLRQQPASKAHAPQKDGILSGAQDAVFHVQVLHGFTPLQRRRRFLSESASGKWHRTR